MIQEDLDILINNNDYDLFICSTINMLIQDINCSNKKNEQALRELISNLKMLKRKINYKLINSQKVVGEQYEKDTLKKQILIFTNKYDELMCVKKPTILETNIIISLQDILQYLNYIYTFSQLI